MADQKLIPVSYFPGCSMATTAKENNESLKAFCRVLGFNLFELPDWNCCGSSSAHSIDGDLAQLLPERNLSLAPPGRPLMAACPSCLLRLSLTRQHLLNDPELQRKYEENFGRSVDPDLEIIHFFELFDYPGINKIIDQHRTGLKGLTFAPYYGCMLARPPGLGHASKYVGLLERVLGKFGAEPVRWMYPSRCCGTFLSVVRPDVITPMVDNIVSAAQMAGADCMVTACAMCHMNLEIRCNLKKPPPIFHFSELLAMAAGIPLHVEWFKRHLIDPLPLLKDKDLLSGMNS